MSRKAAACKSNRLEACNFDDNLNQMSKKMLCCALYRPADVVKKNSQRTLIYNNQFKDAKCWHCTHPFTDTAWRFPISFDSDSRDYKTIGHFCSPSCAAAWGDIHYHHNMAQHMCWLRSLAMEHGIHEFAPAPHTHWLQDFGGNMTIDAFRQLGCKDKHVVQKTLPFVSIPIVLERASDLHLTEAKEVTRQVKAQNKKATSQAMNNENITSRGLYHEFLEKNGEEPPCKKIKSSKKKKDAAQPTTQDKGTLRGLFKKRTRDKT